MPTPRTHNKALDTPALLSGFGPTPDSAEMAAIAPFTLGEIPADALYVRRMVVANDAIDRTYEQFPLPYLQRFAETLPGKSLLVSHDKYDLATGLVYRAHVRPSLPGEPGNYSLEAAFYLVKTPDNESLRAAIDAGVVRWVSIGFRYDTRICDICQEDYWDCPHRPGDTTAAGQLVTMTYGGDLSQVEASEVSLVYLGAQRGAQVTKEFPMEKELIELKAKAADLAGQLATAQTEAAKATDALDRLKQAETKAAALEAQIKETAEKLAAAEAKLTETQAPDAEKAALIQDGQAYREFLRGEVKRLAGIIKSEAEADLLLTALPHAPAKSLRALADSYQEKVNERFPPQPSGELPTPTPAGEQAPSDAPFRRPVRLA